MKRILLLNTQSVLIIFLITGFSNPIYAIQFIPETFHTKAESPSIKDAVVQNLADRGLERSTAQQKTADLFNGSLIDTKLTQLQMHPSLMIGTEPLIASVAKRALFDRKVNMNDYHSLLGLVQDINGKCLNKDELEAVKNIAMMDHNS
jgi:hypothetical protein